MHSPARNIDSNPDICPNDIVTVLNEFHSRYGETGMVTGTMLDRFSNPKYPYYSRVKFSDSREFWINNGVLELVHNNHSPNIPGDEG